jgi:hypothetical protein
MKVVECTDMTFGDGDKRPESVKVKRAVESGNLV